MDGVVVHFKFSLLIAAVGFNASFSTISTLQAEILLAKVEDNYARKRKALTPAQMG